MSYCFVVWGWLVVFVELGRLVLFEIGGFEFCLGGIGLVFSFNFWLFGDKIR